MTQYKTILAPNAPWPVFEQVEPVVRVARKPALKAQGGSKRQRTRASHIDANFERWLASLTPIKERKDKK